MSHVLRSSRVMLLLFALVLAPASARAEETAGAWGAGECTACCDRCTSCPAGCTCAQQDPPGGEGGKCKPREPLERTTVFGVRGSFTSTDGSEADGTFGAATFAVASEQYRTNGLLAMRASSYAALGGGTAGLEGGLAGTAMIGVRAPLGMYHGPVLRVGLGGELLGNSRFYFSRIELPIGEVGYQYLQGKTVLELGARGAPILTGRYNTGHVTRRELGTSFEWGGYLAAHADFGRVDVSFTRVEANKTFPGDAVNMLRAWACLRVVGPVGACADLMYVRGGAYFGPPDTPTTVTSLYGGATLGFMN